VLFRSQETLALEDKSWFTHWEQMTSGQFRHHNVIGTHANLLEEPYVQDLADKLRGVLDDVVEAGDRS
jgi:thioesterase domain-containing protein